MNYYLYVVLKAEIISFNSYLYKVMLEYLRIYKDILKLLFFSDISSHGINISGDKLSYLCNKE